MTDMNMLQTHILLWLMVASALFTAWTGQVELALSPFTVDNQ